MGALEDNQLCLFLARGLVYPNLTSRDFVGGAYGVERATSAYLEDPVTERKLRVSFPTGEGSSTLVLSGNGSTSFGCGRSGPYMTHYE